MADCGASGTTLDRVVRAATGRNVVGSDGGKQAVVSLVGHAGMIGTQGPFETGMPLAPPTSLVSSPSTVSHTSSVHWSHDGVQGPAAPMTSSMEQMWASQPPAPQQQLAALQRQQQGRVTMHPAMHQNSMIVQHHHQQQQQHMMMHQMHQMNLYLSQQQQHANEARHSQQISNANIQVVREEHTVSVESWHEGLEEELLVGNEEGGVQGATIEELAAAWQAAEADYYEEAVNMGAAIPQDDATLLYPYEFTEETEVPPKELSVPHDWMNEGMAWFEQGEIARAIRCFETEVRHVHEDNAKAWHMLGRCHAENDEDRKAIACLERSVERDPYNPQALLALGVSYVNELHPAQALQNLKAWITHNPRYAGLELDDDMYGSASNKDTESEFDQVQRLLFRALDYGDDDDGDIQEALGVVFNVSRDYGAAVEAFRKALQARGENDYSLWNKLGATLANSNQSEGALPAYHRALQLKPKYARAWLNMAISHSNLQNYDEAARCYLQTLSLNPAAVHCWSYLRIALSCSEQWDLIPLAAAQDLKAFREHYDFVIYSNS